MTALARNHPRLALGAGIVALAVVLYISVSGAPASRVSTTPAMPRADHPAAHDVPALEMPASLEQMSQSVAAEAEPAAIPGIESIERIRHSLEIYKATMVFPPWSRPLDDSTRNVLEWNKPWPAGQPFAADKDRREIRVDASLDKLFAGAGEPFTVRVSVTYDQPPNAPVAPDQLIGHVRYLDGDWKDAAEVVFSRTGDRYVASFTPSAIPALAARQHEAQLVVHVQMGELFPKDLVMPFQYAADNAFAVTGLAADRATSDGSLEVALEVDVVHVAPTLIQAVLFDADGKRGIATYSDYFRPTATGKQEVPIKFYGKSIYDSHVSGRYRIVALNGHVKLPDATPPEVFWARAERLPPLITANAYSAVQFTHDAWTSPDKDAKIKQYEDLIRDAGGQP